MTCREERLKRRAGRPVEQRSRHGTVRKLAKRPSSNLGDCGFDSRLCHFEKMRRLGIGEPNCL